MLRKLIFVPVVALFFVLAAIPGRAQVASAAYQGKWNFAVGGGLSDYSIDWGYDRKMLGITAWGDYHLPKMPPVLKGLSLEAEVRDINYHRPSSLPRMRQDTYMVGALYSWRKYDRVRPYGKFLIGIGSIDFGVPNSGYTHDTRTVTAPGVGVDFRVWNKVSVRGL
jgi:opacity protein-like surface antigen